MCAIALYFKNSLSGHPVPGLPGAESAKVLSRIAASALALSHLIPLRLIPAILSTHRRKPDRMQYPSML